MMLDLVCLTGSDRAPIDTTQQAKVGQLVLGGRGHTTCWCMEALACLDGGLPFRVLFRCARDAELQDEATDHSEEGCPIVEPILKADGILKLSPRGPRG